MSRNQLSSAEIARKKIFWLVRRSKFAQECDEENYTHLVTLRRHIWELQSISLLTNSVITTCEITERSQVCLLLRNDRHFKTDFSCKHGALFSTLLVDRSVGWLLTQSFFPGQLLNHCPCSAARYYFSALLVACPLRCTPVLVSL